MSALLYKFKQLLKCKQSYYHNCLSSNGPFSLYKVQNTINYICDPVYDIKQRRLLNTGIEINSVTSWNIQELFWHCYKGEKINKILNYILSSESCVICIQEAFEIPTLDAIIFNEDIKSKYPYFLTGSLANRFIIGENSGLLVLSKHPIIFKQFTPFYKTTWPDGFASKGALYFSTGGLNFINTHLQSDDNVIACLQLKQILSENPFFDSTFLIGDLNLECPQIFTNTFINNTQITHKDTKTILDHIININQDIDFTVCVDNNIIQCSDHYPLVATIN